MAKTAAEPKARQAKLDGFTPKKIQEVEDAAEKYDEAVQERMALTEKEVATGDELLRVMERNKIVEYRVGNTIFRVTEGKRKVKRVRVAEVEKDGEVEGAETE